MKIEKNWQGKGVTNFQTYGKLCIKLVLNIISDLIAK